MTPEAKRHLSSTIRSLRSRLLQDLKASTEGAYRLSVRARDAGLDEATAIRRSRLEGWVAEQGRTAGKNGGARSPEEFFREAEKQAAYTLLNRLVILRLMEAWGLRSPRVLSEGWESIGYKQFRENARALVQQDETEGYAFLLRLIFEDLALELPGLYGSVGVVDLIPVPAATLRHVVETLSAPELESCWTDDMTLGWVYQYWNDPDREALDEKLNAGGKVESHEIASKTQMFTERYMVDWLLQNSFGPMWLAMCRKHGWTPEVEAEGVLQRLEERRADWRQKRASGDVPLTTLMPLHTAAERRWAYYVPQLIPEDAVRKAPDSVREIKILDPAVGSGHFLVIAFDLLAALYREEARHRGEHGGGEWSEQAIVERILEHNLHGIDLDPRAIQIAAAALWLKAQRICRDAHPSRINLVASNLRLSSLADDDPALLELRREVEAETGIPGDLTDTIVHALRGADYLGSLLKVDAAVDGALRRHEVELARSGTPEQAGLWEGEQPRREMLSAMAGVSRASVLARLERFLSRHSGADDLGLRLRGEQLEAGVRFVRMVRARCYDLVVANPPYQGASKMRDSEYVKDQYPLGKADLYAAFLQRGLELLRDGGTAALVTMRNWMFATQYKELREQLVDQHHLLCIGDVSWGAFEEMRDNPVTMSVFQRRKDPTGTAVAIAPGDPQGRIRTKEELDRKKAGLLAHEMRYDFSPGALTVVPDRPMVYWWTDAELDFYSAYETIGKASPAKFGLNLGNNTRFTRARWEVLPSSCADVKTTDEMSLSVRHSEWCRYLMGATGVRWMDPVDTICRWRSNALQLKVSVEHRYGTVSRKITNEQVFFRPGIGFVMIGSEFGARAHRWRCVIDGKGSSLYPEDLPSVLCLMNSTRARKVLSSLNPGLDFTVGDVNRLPLFPISGATEIFSRIEQAFTAHECHRESSIEFREPGPSPWLHAQEWAQAAVDRNGDAPLPPYQPKNNREPPTDHLSFALGVALGRFGLDGHGILSPAEDDLSQALPAGILFLDGSLASRDYRDGLGDPATIPLHTAWEEYGVAPATRRDSLRDWLRLDFFGDVHRRMYENRPIHWPLSSSNRTFVAWVNIHRWTDQTLRILLADHLQPALSRIEGELNDLLAARDGSDAKAARAAERRYNKAFKAKEELVAFMKDVEQCADRGAPPTDSKCQFRQVDARYVPDLDDGVMINSAALWPLLEPQWKDPKKWWKELATASGRKDYDWARLAMRYWPTRVDRKCQEDPSLGVAHGCFWRYHPARAWAWELRLQDEIAPDFRIREAPYRGDGGDTEHRETWLRDQPESALAAVEREAIRRMGRGKSRRLISDMSILEPGLWSELPDQCWDLELRVSEKQGVEFRLLAPDEPTARAAYETAYPERVVERAEILVNLVPDPVLLLDDEDEFPTDEQDEQDQETEDEAA